MAQVDVRLADYSDPVHREALLLLLDAYARDPAGGGTPLGEFVHHNLVHELASRPYAFSVLAFDGAQPVGLVNCFEGFSTFACKPLVNVHDVVVLQSHRGRRIAPLMLAKVEEVARERGACKLTLEVLSGNTQAMKAYEREGFSGYQLDPSFGTATFMHKKL
ncbi:N-acetyltransferase [Variovorax sp. OV329]|uniref:GNAT family N-acetyltransferase n=1 Tax=Variovorax sp. OV329 TaxID=1882825 RepID=UPI0008EDC2B8|nr:GNAT family N-acetyltransferase [Variovorax sp. OV329]SFM44836.1 Acetyltransferase (GNAT) family protein [Variovorax sp. OV329]